VSQSKSDPSLVCEVLDTETACEKALSTFLTNCAGYLEYLFTKRITWLLFSSFFLEIVVFIMSFHNQNRSYRSVTAAIACHPERSKG
jgi:hypothetical protein